MYTLHLGNIQEITQQKEIPTSNLSLGKLNNIDNQLPMQREHTESRMSNYFPEGGHSASDCQFSLFIPRF